MLYPKNQTPSLPKELFQNPTSEYRGAPFWAWNGKLDPRILTAQIHIFKQMGMGGFHMHVRTGMDSPYLGKEFMSYIRLCIETAREQHMLAWLYDEDRWPSGTAGGRVTAQKPENARKSLLFTAVPYPQPPLVREIEPEPGRGQENIRQENGILLAVYDIYLNEDGTLRQADRAETNSPLAKGSTRWYAYMEYASEDPWFNNHAYVDTLNPDAVSEFIRQTHEAYYEYIGDYFGSTVPAIFTDEPQFTPKQPLGFAKEKKDVFLPWTADFARLYQQCYGEDLLDHLPELLWELPNGLPCPARWCFQNLLTDLFVQNYCMQIGGWCRDHSISLTGHVMGEGSLYSQTQAVGDAMRCYRAFGIPGIDMLCDFHEYTTVKQAQSIVRQAGREGMLSELYGVTGWDYDFRGYKLQGDWQAALGVTVRVPHLAFMTMKGEAKRDYPSSIGYQSPWWKEYSMVEDHFARLNTALTRGEAVVRVAVIHPIESYWLYWGPNDQTAETRAELDRQYSRLAETLLFGCIDFDYLCEAELPSLCKLGGFPLNVGHMHYHAILVPYVCTLRSTTLSLLEAFAREGGKLIFLGDCPPCVDARPSPAIQGLYQASIHPGPLDSSILAALESERFLDIRREDGCRENNLLHQLRRENCQDLWLFVCNGRNPESPDADPSLLLRFILKGIYQVTLYDTLTGSIQDICVWYEGGKTIFERRWYMHDSMLLLLHTVNKTSTLPKPFLLSSCPGQAADWDLLPGRVQVALSDPNMLLLDMAEYSLNGGDYFSEEELLRIDNYVRQQLGIPIRRKEVVQSYLLEPESPADFLKLRFRIKSETSMAGLELALEEPASAIIHLNGKAVTVKETGYYVDEDIRTIPLPDFVAGENILEIQVLIGRRTNLEYFYLLGNFGVQINGTSKTLTPLVPCLGWGDIVPQGLPFYTGVLTYHMQIHTQGDFTVRIPQYRGGLVKVLVDGHDCGNIAYSPYTLTVQAEPGDHQLSLRLFTTRYNGFGQLHHTQGVYFYQSPNSWRSAGDLWSYEYRFRPSGILKSPELKGAVFLDEFGKSRSGFLKAFHVTDRS